MRALRVRRRCWMLAVVPAALALLGLSSPQKGVLRIETEEGVEVIWEGVSLGSTDERGELEIAGIPPGRYSVVLRKAGYVEQRVSASVPAGETTLSLRLERLPAPEPWPGTAAPAGRRGGKAEPVEEPGPEPEPVATPATAPELPVAEPAGPASGPLSAADRQVVEKAAAEEATEDRADASDGGFGLGFAALLLALAAVWVTVVHRRRRAPAAPERGVRLDPGGPAVVHQSRARGADAVTPAFLEELRRREVALDGFLESEGGRVERRVVDIGPRETDPAEESS